MIVMQPDWLGWPETQALMQAVSPLRFVGGCVRDALLGRRSGDIDAATPLPPDTVMQRLRVAGHKAIPTGIEHGTVTARIGSRHFEVTTLRRDVSTDGRHATVAYTEDWREDASRRDFTMNALYCDGDGRLFDYFGGREDAVVGHVRFIGDAKQRIHEDSLRILRFFRFHAHYGCAVADGEGLAACGELAALIDRLSGERIREEMLKLLVAQRAGEAVGLMQRHAVWERIAPARVRPDMLERLSGVLHRAGHAPDALLALALLLRSAGGGAEALVDAIADRWKLSRAQHKRLGALCEAGGAWHEAEWKSCIRAWGRELFIDRAVLAMAEGVQETALIAAIMLAREWEVPLFPVTGDDLIALGVKPGKELGATLRRLEEAWEADGYAASKETLLARVR